MYVGINGFKRSIDPDMLDHPLHFTGVSQGECHFTGEYKTYDAENDVINITEILVHCGMYDLENFSYHHSESLDELLESDLVKVYINRECVLWVS